MNLILLFSNVRQDDIELLLIDPVKKTKNIRFVRRY